MAIIKIPFNGTNYNIEESSLSEATASLQSHLSTVINGEGATIEFGGTEYSIDSTKLSTATSDFIAHLATIAGSGLKVVVNGVEYSVDPTKLNDAAASLEAVLSSLGGSADGLEPITWDGVIGDRKYGYLGSNNSIKWVKVSDKIFTPEELLGANINVYINAYDTNYSITVTEDMIIEDTYTIEILDQNNPLLGKAILYFIVKEDGSGALMVNSSIGNAYFPGDDNGSRTGLYCLYIEGGATSTLTFPS